MVSLVLPETFNFAPPDLIQHKKGVIYDHKAIQKVIEAGLSFLNSTVRFLLIPISLPLVFASFQ